MESFGYRLRQFRPPRARSADNRTHAQQASAQCEHGRAGPIYRSPTVQTDTLGGLAGIGAGSRSARSCSQSGAGREPWHPSGWPASARAVLLPARIRSDRFRFKVMIARFSPDPNRKQRLDQFLDQQSGNVEKTLINIDFFGPAGDYNNNVQVFQACSRRTSAAAGCRSAT